MKIVRIWEILSRFKDACKRRGWKTCENEDWVEIDENYHNFLSTRDVHPSSFKRLASNRKCVIRQGITYDVVEPACTAWLFSKTPSNELVKMVSNNPNFSSTIAIFDLSPMLEGKNRCAKLNNTDSPVFQEFEKFLRSELKIKVEPFPSLSDSKISLGTCEIPEPA